MGSSPTSATRDLLSPRWQGVIWQTTISLETSLVIMGLVPSILCSLLFLSSFIWVKENVRTWGKNT